MWQQPQRFRAEECVWEDGVVDSMMELPVPQPSRDMEGSFGRWKELDGQKRGHAS